MGIGQCQTEASKIATYGITLGKNQMSPVPLLFYRIMLSSEYDKDIIIRNTQPEILKKAIGFAQDHDLRNKMYSCLRDNIFQHGGCHQSILINEIIGICGFIKKVIKFATLTLRMHLW